ncbi:divalent metal cation transporter [Paraburkholderia sp. A2WS-5]|uniref:NRAMP family divalent metal transporter n=2 Tax=unclassified Paraburkholderia TaxID=2615204 RepID=UPI003B763C3E
MKHGDRPAHAWAVDMRPGLATTGTDNDPSGILTYSLAGAQYGFDLLWICVLSYPSMVALQLIATRVAAVTGKGLTENMREHYSRWLFLLAVGRFLLANTLNMAADMLAMGEGAQQIFRGPVALLTLAFAGASLALQWWVPYARYAGVVKWLCIALFCYAGTLLVADVQWRVAGWHALVPDVTLSEGFLGMLVAVLGTTVSPYLLFSQAEEEVEERGDDASQANVDRAQSREEPRQLQGKRHETLIRTLLSNGAGALILCASAATLHAQHMQVNSVSDAAKAILPLAHGFAAQVLGLALLGTALLALPPLAGSAAHAAASSFGLARGKRRDRRIAVVLLVLMAMSAATALLFGALGVDAVKACYWSALTNGMTVTPVLILLVLLSRHPEAVGTLKFHWFVRALSWLAVVAAGAALTAHTILPFL